MLTKPFSLPAPPPSLFPSDMSSFSTTANSAASATATPDDVTVEAITVGVAAVSMAEEATTTKRGTPCKRCLKMKEGGKCYQHQPKPSEGVSVDVDSSLTHIVPLPSSPDESAASANVSSASAMGSSTTEEDRPPLIGEEMIAAYVEELREEISIKKLSEFWIMPQRPTSKPFKAMKFERAEMEKHIIDNLSIFSGKLIASISLVVSDNPKKSIEEGNRLLNVHIECYRIRQSGEIDHMTTNSSPGADWLRLRVEYYEEDFMFCRFKLADVVRLAKLCAKGSIYSDFFSRDSFSELKEKLKAKHIDFYPPSTPITYRPRQRRQPRLY